MRPWREVPPQHGRTVVVTGAGGGLGLETARALAGAGARVVMAVRSLERGRRAAAGLEGLAGPVEVRLLDVADLASVRAFVQQLVDDGVRPDVLVNNAGVMATPFGRSPDGVELQLATNHLGHFALANLLLPHLGDRVVVVSSNAHRAGRLELDDLDWARRGYSPMGAYAQSKLCNLLFLAELQRRLTAAGSTLRATGAHPGSTHTAITSQTGNRLATAVGAFGHRLVGMPAWQGALPVLYAATMDVPGNSYLGPHRLGGMQGWPVPVGRSQAAGDPALARALWDRSEELSGFGFGLGGR